jgi:phosphatidylglycerophosphate synthase
MYNIADKLFINALSISLWAIGTLPTALVGLWLIRDMILMIATHQYVAQNTSPGMAVMDPVTVPIQVIPTTLSKINTGLQFITLVIGIVAVPLPDTVLVVAATTSETSAVPTMVTAAIETVTESKSTILDDNYNDTIKLNWYDFNNLFLLQRTYITEHILSPLCWMTGATTIGSSLSYYGHSAFISTKQSMPNTDRRIK